MRGSIEIRSILREGRNCWRKAPALRTAFLVDADAYFGTLAAAMERAERSILIVGWDIDSRLDLRRGDPTAGPPLILGPFLRTLLERRRKLHIHVLAWDFPMLYALEREPFPLLNTYWRNHRRLHFRLDSRHPRGACHHQKMVVVDDRIAFVGGLDLTSRRWDTPGHRPDDPGRIDPWGEPYLPFHDVQMAVDGPAAAAVGDLARERWFRATGRRLRRPEAAGDPWPEGLLPDLEDVGVAISRTVPGDERTKGIHEVEMLWTDALAAARRCIYIESQYLTAAGSCEVLARRLAEDDGPEEVIVGPREAAGWLEQATMGVLRHRHLKRLLEVDAHGRLGAYFPHHPGLKSGFIQVHSKVLIVDDRLLRIGSSNLNNRSMGLDTECDLTIESGGNPRVERGIAAFRARLLGEHLGMAPAEVAAEVVARGSVLRAVEALRGDGRTLLPLSHEVPDWMDRMVPEKALFDPERPIYDERLIHDILPGQAEDSRVRPAILLSLVLFVLGLLAMAWRWTPLVEWADPDQLLRWGEAARDHPLAPLLVLAVYVLGGLVAFPVSILTLVTGVLFGWWRGFIFALLGSVASAMVTYAIGRALGKDTVRRFAGKKLARLSARVSQYGFLAVVGVRVIPFAPFTLVNLMAGAAQVGVRDYLFGTIVGTIPGMLLFVIFGDQLKAALRDVDVLTLLVLLITPAGLSLLGLWVARLLQRKNPRPSSLQGSG